MSAKRANGEGSVRRKSNGRWEAALTVGYDSQGKQKRRYFSGKTQTEARDKLRAAQRETSAWQAAEAHSLSVEEYLAQWLSHKERHVRSKTMLEYRGAVTEYLLPCLGRKRLTALCPLDVERMMSAMSDDGATPRAVQGTLKVLKVSLNQARDWGLLSVSPAERVKPPKLLRKEMTVWTPDEVRRFLRVSQSHRLHALFYLALSTGMRRGELLGLHWDSVSLDRGELRVERSLVSVGSRTELGEPKTESSRRVVTLSSDTVELLRDYRLSLELRHGVVPEMVFPSTVRTHLNPNNVLRTFAVLIGEADVPKIRFHDLRHTAASLLIRREVSAKVVAERLGHSNPGITLSVYTHLYDDQRRAAAMPLEEMLR